MNRTVNQTLRGTAHTAFIMRLSVLALLLASGVVGLDALGELAVVLLVGIVAGTGSAIVLVPALLVDLSRCSPGVPAAHRTGAAAAGQASLRHVRSCFGAHGALNMFIWHTRSVQRRSPDQPGQS